MKGKREKGIHKRGAHQQADNSSEKTDMAASDKGYAQNANDDQLSHNNDVKTTTEAYDDDRVSQNQ